MVLLLMVGSAMVLAEQRRRANLDVLERFVEQWHQVEHDLVIGCLRRLVVALQHADQLGVGEAVRRHP
jgi:hypothetical protein